jgi:hypothetical protein
MENQIKALIEKYEERIKVIDYDKDYVSYGGWSGNDLPNHIQAEYDTLKVVIHDL